MSHPATITVPKDQEQPAGADAMRADTLIGLQHRDATDVMRMLFRSECFLEDLDEDAYACAMH